MIYILSAFITLPAFYPFLLTAHSNEVFSKIYVENKHFVYNQAYMQTRNHDIAEDITQNVFIMVINKIDEFEGKSSSIIKYLLFQLARTKLRAYYNLKKREILADEEDIFDKNYYLATSVEQYVSGNETIEMIKIFLAMLKPLHRDVFTLKTDGYKHEEIGKFLNISPANSKKLYQRTRERLMEHLGGQWNE